MRIRLATFAPAHPGRIQADFARCDALVGCLEKHARSSNKLRNQKSGKGLLDNITKMKSLPTERLRGTQVGAHDLPSIEQNLTDSKTSLEQQLETLSKLQSGDLRYVSVEVERLKKLNQPLCCVASEFLSDAEHDLSQHSGKKGQQQHASAHQIRTMSGGFTSPKHGNWYPHFAKHGAHRIVHEKISTSSAFADSTWEPSKVHVFNSVHTVKLFSKVEAQFVMERSNVEETCEANIVEDDTRFMTRKRRCKHGIRIVNELDDTDGVPDATEEDSRGQGPPNPESQLRLFGTGCLTPCLLCVGVFCLCVCVCFVCEGSTYSQASTHTSDRFVQLR